MSTIVTPEGSKASSPESNSPCRVLVLYEDSSARLKAMQMCERLVSQFNDDLVFEFSWLKFQRLTNPSFAARAMDTAASADIVMFCTHGNDLPPEGVAWLDGWPPAGSNSKRAIALLYAEPFSTTASLGALRYRLENASIRLGMDFLPLVLPLPNVDEAAAQRPFPIPPSNQNPLNLNYHSGLNE